MMPHWDLFPGEDVTLISYAGKRHPATYVTSDTLRVYFRMHREADEPPTGFRRLPDGGLAKQGRRWTIDGTPRHTRGLLEEMPARGAKTGG